MKKLLPFVFSVLYTLHLAAQGFYFNILEPSSVYASYDSSAFTHPGQDQFWGWNGILAQELVGELVYADDVNGIHEFCESNSIDYTGQIVLIDRGGCEFGIKALFAQSQGAAAVVIANNTDDLVLMAAGTSGQHVDIPVILLSKSVADPIKAVLESGAQAVASFSFEPFASTFITGRMIADDGDCLPNAEILNISSYTVDIESELFSKTVVANAHGFYMASVIPGNYEVTLSPDIPLWSACPPQNITIGQNEVLELDLLATANVDCPYLVVDIATNLLRRCFDTNVFYINYCNDGSALAEEVFIHLELPDLISIVNTESSYTEISDNVFEFLLGDLAIGQCGTIKLIVELSCEAELGQTLCSSVEIFPQANCYQTTNAWNGVDIRAHAICSEDGVIMKLINEGTSNMPESKSYRVIGNDEVLKIDDFQLAVGESLSLPFDASGITYRIETDHIPLNPVNASPSAAVEACISSSAPTDFEYGFINQFPTPEYGDFYDITCIEVIGSFDPNDKQSSLRGYGPEHYIDQNVPLEYKIRFQNTGTDTAFTVFIVDTLSQWFDLSSIRPLASSHTYNFSLTDHILRVDFPNILLPDSTTNEIESNGFITFKINQVLDVPLESEIINRAAIYFDFNEPVITNSVFHTVGKDFLPVVLSTNQLHTNADLHLFPNPVSNELSIQLKENYLLNSSFQIFNNIGELVYTMPLDDRYTYARINHLEAGAYFYTIRKNNKQIGFGKLVKME